MTGAVVTTDQAAARHVRADQPVAKIVPQSLALIDTAALATAVNREMAPALRQFSERAGPGARALATCEIEHRAPDGSLTTIKARVDLIGGR